MRVLFFFKDGGVIGLWLGTMQTVGMLYEYEYLCVYVCMFVFLCIHECVYLGMHVFECVL